MQRATDRRASREKAARYLRVAWAAALVGAGGWGTVSGSMGATNEQTAPVVVGAEEVYIHELIEENKLGGRANGRDVARGGGCRYRITGNTNPGEVTEHEFVLLYKFAVRKRWAYRVLAPGVSFRRDGDWDAEPSIQVRLDMLFWNVGER